MKDDPIPPPVAAARDLLASTVELPGRANREELIQVLTLYRHALRALLVYAWPKP